MQKRHEPSLFLTSRTGTENANVLGWITSALSMSTEPLELLLLVVGVPVWSDYHQHRLVEQVDPMAFVTRQWKTHCFCKDGSETTQQLLH
jgi:hypothetical protein